MINNLIYWCSSSLTPKKPCYRLLVYVTSQLRHSLMVQPHLRKILDPPLPCRKGQTCS